MKTPSILAALILSATAATAHEFTLGDLTINHATSFETPVTAKTGVGYLTITNAGTEADRLLGVKADFPRVMIHDTEEKDGVARMFHIDAIEIPAGETVTLEPGGMHVMFMGLDGDPLEVGEKIPATLIFESAGEIDVEFSVEARAKAAKKHDHSDHSGHGETN